MYFEANKTRMGCADARTADVPVRPSKSLYCWRMHTNNIAWTCELIGELEHDLATLESKAGTDVGRLFSKMTLDGRPRDIENCKKDLAAIRSLKAELDAETDRFRKAKQFWAPYRTGGTDNPDSIPSTTADILPPTQSSNSSNALVTYAFHEDYNQEDSAIFNRAAVDSCLFNGESPPDVASSSSSSPHPGFNSTVHPSSSFSPVADRLDFSHGRKEPYGVIISTTPQDDPRRDWVGF